MSNATIICISTKCTGNIACCQIITGEDLANGVRLAFISENIHHWCLREFLFRGSLLELCYCICNKMEGPYQVHVQTVLPLELVNNAKH